MVCILILFFGRMVVFFIYWIGIFWVLEGMNEYFLSI